MQEGFRIGEVAGQTGVSIDTVRYYERRRLLPIAPRTASGYRVFTSEAVERVRFIKQAQEWGFSRDEIGTILATGGESDCIRVRDLLETKLTELDARMKSMGEFRQRLSHFLAECEEELKRHPGSAECPVVFEIAQAQRK